MSREKNVLLLAVLLFTTAPSALADSYLGYENLMNIGPVREAPPRTRGRAPVRKRKVLKDEDDKKSLPPVVVAPPLPRQNSEIEIEIEEGEEEVIVEKKEKGLPPVVVAPPAPEKKKDLPPVVIAPPAPERKKDLPPVAVAPPKPVKVPHRRVEVNPPRPPRDIPLPPVRKKVDEKKELPPVVVAPPAPVRKVNGPAGPVREIIPVKQSQEEFEQEKKNLPPVVVAPPIPGKRLPPVQIKTPAKKVPEVEIVYQDDEEEYEEEEFVSEKDKKNLPPVAVAPPAPQRRVQSSPAPMPRPMPGKPVPQASAPQAQPAEPVVVVPAPAPKQDEPSPVETSEEEGESDELPPVAAAPAPAPAAPAAESQAPVTENRPGSIGQYVEDSRTPKYLRINVKGYNVRTSPEFERNRRDNIAFQTEANAFYSVSRTVPTADGVAVGIHVSGKEHWVFVPNNRKNDFQFCESVACFADVSMGLAAIAEATLIDPAYLESCGVRGIDSEGRLVLHPRKVDQTQLPPARPPVEEDEPRVTAPAPRPQPPQRRPSSGALSVKPLWENAKPGVGPRWTEMLRESLQRHGQGLLNLKSFNDQNQFCPGYSKLNAAEREEFWVHLMVGVSRYESNFNTDTTFNEATRRNERFAMVNPHVHSQGLFQLSYGSAGQSTYSNYCRFNYEANRNKVINDRSHDIYNPKKQMDCAVGIMNHWVSRDRGLGLTQIRDQRGRVRYQGGANFWSTLRKTNPSTAQVRHTLKRFPACFR